MGSNISIFLPSLEGGGAEKMMLNLSAELAHRGYTVTIVVSNLEGEFTDRVPESVGLVNLKAPPIPGYSLLGALPSLIKYLRRDEPDVFLSVLNRANIVAVLAHTLSRVDCRLIVSERNNLSKFIHETHIRNRLLPYLISVTYPRADGIIAISNGLADDLANIANLPRDEINVIYNPAYTSDIIPKAKTEIEHPWFQSDSKVILGVGSLSTQKDFSTLIKSFKILRREKNCKLIILGKGDKKYELEMLIEELSIQEHVDLAGFVDNPYAYMGKSDVFVLSSRWEGFGNVIVEAMACGTPVVSTDCPSGPSEILKNGKYGKLAPIGEPKSLATAVSSVMENPTDSTILKRRAKDFSVENIATEYENVLIQ